MLCQSLALQLGISLHSFTPPGPAYDISFWEVRDDSLLVQWKAPVYSCASPITGYFLEMAKKGSTNFIAVNAEAVNRCYLKVIDDFLNACILNRVPSANRKQFMNRTPQTVILP